MYFPAKEQFLCGDYKLIVTVVTEAEGWGKCNSRTYTTDYGTVFTLVDDESGTDDGSIDLDDTESSSSDNAGSETHVISDKPSTFTDDEP